MDYAKQYQDYLVRVNAALETACNTYLPEESDVCRAARYSLLGGGKRIRAVLVLAVCDMLNGNAAAADQFAAAVEMLHCYSLIHDDLPCMDNDDLRRGKPSCHKAFGEATAMLAGDVLLTEAFEVIANVEAPAIVNVRAAKALGAGAGSRGMATRPVRSSTQRSRWVLPPHRPTRPSAKSWKVTPTASAWCSRSWTMCWMSSARRSSWASPLAVTARTARPPSSPSMAPTVRWSCLPGAACKGTAGPPQLRNDKKESITCN